MKCLVALGVVVGFVMLPIASAMAGGAHVHLVHNEQQDIVYALPLKSPFKLARKTPDGVEFSGRTEIRGHYVFGHMSPEEELGMPDMQPVVYFVPDAVSAALLPRWNEMNVINGFYLTNGDEFLAKVVAPDIVRKVRSRRIKSVTGELSIVIEGYSADVICGWPIYAAKFIGVAEKAVQMAKSKFADSISCNG